MLLSWIVEDSLIVPRLLSQTDKKPVAALGPEFRGKKSRGKRDHDIYESFDEAVLA